MQHWAWKVTGLPVWVVRSPKVNFPWALTENVCHVILQENIQSLLGYFSLGRRGKIEWQPPWLMARLLTWLLAYQISEADMQRRDNLWRGGWGGCSPAAVSQWAHRSRPSVRRINCVLSAVPVAGLYLSSSGIPMDLAERQQVWRSTTESYFNQRPRS